LKGNLSAVFKMLRDHLMQKHGLEIYLVGDTIEFSNDPGDFYLKPYDAVSRWIGYDGWTEGVCCSEFEANLDALYSKWRQIAKGTGVNFIPVATPGFQSTRPSQKDLPVLPKSPDRFRRQMEICKKYVDETIPMLLASTFNDWAENTTIEPTVEEGFQYLQVMKESVSS